MGPREYENLKTNSVQKYMTILKRLNLKTTPSLTQYERPKWEQRWGYIVAMGVINDLNGRNM
jgi:hypothetical protein